MIIQNFLNVGNFVNLTFLDFFIVHLFKLFFIFLFLLQLLGQFSDLDLELNVFELLGSDGACLLHVQILEVAELVLQLRHLRWFTGLFGGGAHPEGEVDEQVDQGLRHLVGDVDAILAHQLVGQRVNSGTQKIRHFVSTSGVLGGIVPLVTGSEIEQDLDFFGEVMLLDNVDGAVVCVSQDIGKWSDVDGTRWGISFRTLPVFEEIDFTWWRAWDAIVIFMSHDGCHLFRCQQVTILESFWDYKVMTCLNWRKCCVEH